MNWTSPPLPAAQVHRTLPTSMAIPIAVLAGLLMDTAYPARGWWPMAWVSVTLVLICLNGRTLASAAAVGGVFGSTFYLANLQWVGAFAGWLPWIALVGLQAGLVTVGSVAIALVYQWGRLLSPRCRVQLGLLPAIVAGTWTLREIVMAAWPYGGFGWARLAASQVDGPIAQAVSWTGADAMCFLVVLVCASLAQIFSLRVIARSWLAAPAAIVALLVVVPQFPTIAVGTMKVGWVQGNGPTAYFDDRSPGAVMTAQSAATAPLIGQPMDLLVWPEGGIDSDPLNRLDTAVALDDLVRRAGAPLLVNAATTRNGRSFNTSLLWTEAGPNQLYDKVNPVPFGEYIPDRWLFQRLAPNLTNLIQRDYVRGELPPVAAVGDVTLGLAICFDLVDDDVIYSAGRAGAQAYIFQSNNADFRGTDENLQQLGIARLRAIETGRPVLNVSTVGTSQAIRADGSTIDEAGAAEVAARITEIPLRTGQTPAVRLGPTLTGLIIWSTLLSLAGMNALIRQRKSSLIAASQRRDGPLPIRADET